MSITMSISLYTAPSRLPDAFAALIERLLLRSREAQVDLLEGDAFGKATAYPVPLTRTLLTNLVQQTLSSDRAIEVTLTYQVVSGAFFTLEVFCYGQRFNAGWAVHYGGPIRLRFAYNDLRRTEGAPWDKVGDNANARQLFTYVCGAGVEVPHGSEFDHGAMYLELGWPAPTGAMMVYHRHIGEFGRDFARIYAEYHWGLRMIPTFDPHLNIWELCSQVGTLASADFWDQPGKQHPAFLKQFQPGLVKFLDQLTALQIRGLAETEDDILWGWLVDSTQTVREVEMVDFNTQGIALMLSTRGLTQGSVWPVYAYLGSVKK